MTFSLQFFNPLLPPPGTVSQGATEVHKKLETNPFKPQIILTDHGFSYLIGRNCPGSGLESEAILC